MSQWKEWEVKLNKRQLKAAGILAVCFLIGLCIAGIMHAIYNTPEKRVIKGLTYLEEEIGELREDMGNELQISTIFNVSGDKLPATIGVDTVLQIEGQNTQTGQCKALADTRFSVMNNELAKLRLYIDEKEGIIQAALPDIWDGYLEFEQDHLDTQYNQSVIADYFGTIPENGLSLHLPGSILQIVSQSQSVLRKLIEDEDLAVEEIGNVTIQAEGGTHRYKCRKYRIYFSEPEITIEAALDRKNHIREMVLSESWDITEQPLSSNGDQMLPGQGQNLQTGILPEMIRIENSQIALLGERRSIDDMNVNYRICTESEKWSWLTEASADKDLLQADLQLDARVICGQGDTVVTVELPKLTILVDGLGEYRVMGVVNADRQSVQVEALTGEASSITEMSEETYLEIEERIEKEIEKWQNADLFG